MSEYSYSSEELPAADRFPWWCELVRRELLASSLLCDEPLAFRAGLRMLDLGVAKVAAPAYTELRCRRTARMVRADDIDMYQLTWVRSGQQRLVSGKTDIVMDEGTLFLMDAARPFEAVVRTPGRSRAAELVETVTVAIPRSHLGLPAARVARLINVPLESTAGAGAVLLSLLRRLVDETHLHGSHDPSGLGTVLRDLTVALLAHRGDVERAVPAESRRRVLLTRIHSFIEGHLDAGSLTPDAVAAAHHISVRHLHRLFQEQGITVGGWIRRRRLERCRHDLLDPRKSGLTLQAIGAHWGFRHAAEFSRHFRAVYGVPPRELRRAGGPPSAAGPRTGAFAGRTVT